MTEDKSVNILVIDDDEDCRELLKVYLEDEPYIISEAGNGFEALEQIKNKTFEVILIDIVMPEMDGMKLLEELGELNISSKVIILSGTNWTKEKHAADLTKFFNVNGTLSKPFSAQQITTLIRKCLEN